MPGYGERVFLNVPFDTRYKKLFDALVFAVQDCGLEARCALESDDASQARVDKLYEIIDGCRFGIHDLSRVTLDAKYRLPRFNMPLELGIFLGAKRFGSGRQRLKSALILDRDRYRYQIYCSDIAGQDVRAHGNDVQSAISAVRDWLSTARQGRFAIPSGSSIATHYTQFRRALPQICAEQQLDVRQLTFIDYRTLVGAWLEVNEL